MTKKDLGYSLFLVVAGTIMFTYSIYETKIVTPFIVNGHSLKYIGEDNNMNNNLRIHIENIENGYIIKDLSTIKSKNTCKTYVTNTLPQLIEQVNRLIDEKFLLENKNNIVSLSKEPYT